MSPSNKRLQFERLQLGQSLKPVELRNAIASAAPVQIRNIAETHTFFDNACIPEKRYKREDYITHVLAIGYFSQQPNWRDIKAQNLKGFIQLNKKGISPEQQMDIEKILSLMESLAILKKGIFVNKWSFVDYYMCIKTDEGLFNRLTLKAIAGRFEKIERLRKLYSKRPEVLLEVESPESNSSALYKYIMAYKAGGAIKQNILDRQKYIQLILK